MATLTSLSKCIRALRDEYGQSQQVFATMLGLSVSSIAHYELANRAPDYLVTTKLFRAAQKVRRHDLGILFKQRMKELEHRFGTMAG